MCEEKEAIIRLSGMFGALDLLEKHKEDKSPESLGILKEYQSVIKEQIGSDEVEA